MITRKSMLRHPAVMLPLIICVIGAATAATSVTMLFNVAIEEEKIRLAQMVHSQAQLMEAVAKFDAASTAKDPPNVAFINTMSQISKAHEALNGFGETGEFVIGKMVDGQVALLQKPRFTGDIHFEVPEFVPEPMSRALAGERGSIIANDYKGNRVMAHYEPVDILNIGLVAKIDVAEVYRPYVFSAGIIAAVTVLMLLIGVYASRQFSVPFLELTREKKRAEDYLNIAGTMIVALDNTGTITLVNSRGAEVLGYAHEDIIGKNWFENFIPEAARDTVKQAFNAILSGDLAPVEQFENAILTQHNGERTISWHNTYIKDDAGKIIGCLSAGADVTRARETEQALRVSDRRFNQSQEFANIGTWDWNIQTGDLYWSPRIAPLFGYPKGELETTYDNFIGAIHPDDRQAVMDAVNNCVESGAEYNIEHRVVWPDGTVRWLLEKGDVVRDDAGSPLNMLGVVQDISASKVMQEQLVQSSKMATLGEMATGVAHELNQPLNVIRMAVNNIMNKSDRGAVDPEYLASKLNKVVSQVERASAIIDHMRIFGRKPDATPALLSPANMVSGALGLIGEQLRLSGVEVTTDVQDTQSCILGHQVQVEQVLLNLLTNARDVLESKAEGDKRITIRVAESDVGDSVRIEVQDNGGGIPDAYLGRIFEPFFTTKEIGKGTGLGLSISYGIVTDMGGTLEARNNGDGGCFTISLPVATAAAA